MAALKNFLFPFLLSNISLASGLPPIAESIKLQQGLQIDRSCIDLAKKYGADSELLTRQMQTLVDEMQKQVGGDCRKRYPELSPYLDQWQDKLKDVVLACGSKEVASKEDREKHRECLAQQGPTLEDRKKCSHLHKTPGVAYHSEQEIKDDFPSATYKRLVEGVDPKKRGNKFDKSGRSVISLQEEFIRELSLGYHQSALKTFTHEIFHFTKANNLTEHNEIESITLDENNVHFKAGQPVQSLCGQNFTKDRIIAVTSLCVNAPAVGMNSMKLPEVLHALKARCGEERACTQLFNASDITNPESSENLDKSSAQSLCQRIYFEGSCQKFLNSESGKRYFYHLEPLKKMYQKVIKRIEQATFPSPGEINPSLFTKIGLAEKDVDHFEKSECFQKNMQKNLSGRWQLNERLKDTSPWNKKYAFEIVKHLEQSSSCQSGESKIMLSSFKKNMEKIYQSDFYQQLWTYRTKGHHQSMGIPFNHDYKNESHNQLFANIVGKPLLDKYLEALRTFHPDSPQFNCLQSPAAGAGIYQHYLDYVKATLKKTCFEDEETL